jgi:hypothetical protein
MADYIRRFRDAVIRVGFSRDRDVMETSTDRNLDRRPCSGNWIMATRDTTCRQKERRGMIDET